jgi:hypothetical protein
MNIAHSWVLLFLAPLALWTADSWRRGKRGLRIALKAAGFAAILFALSEPRMTLPSAKTGIVVLVDTSASITPNDLAQASAMVAGISRHKGRNWMNVAPFAREPRSLLKKEVSGRLRFLSASAEAANGTNIESALVNAMAAVPAITINMTMRPASSHVAWASGCGRTVPRSSGVCAG